VLSTLIKIVFLIFMGLGRKRINTKLSRQVENSLVGAAGFGRDSTFCSAHKVGLTTASRFCLLAKSAPAFES
jgi:hypothetical protein